MRWNWAHLMCWHVLQEKWILHDEVKSEKWS